MINIQYYNHSGSIMLLLFSNDNKNMAGKFLTAEWKNLVMANYVIDPEILKPFLPEHTELDLYDSKCYVSLIGFLFAETRLLGFKIPFHINFEEVNLRFYVRYKDGEQWKRGTVFIKEIVPRYAITFIARTFYSEKYSTMPMKHYLIKEGGIIKAGYHWKSGKKWNKIEATAALPAQAMKIGSTEEFIAEHYWGYSKHKQGVTFEYGVEHPAWEVYPVKEFTIECDFRHLYGESFAALSNQEPDSVFLCKGSPVIVKHKRKILR